MTLAIFLAKEHECQLAKVQDEGVRRGKGCIVKHLIHGFGEGMAQYQVEFYSRGNQNRLPALPKKTSLIDNIAGYEVQRTMSFRILPQLFAS